MVTASAAFTAVGVIYQPLWFLVFIGPAPFFAILFSPARTPDLKRAILFGAWFGFVYNAVFWIGVLSVYPLDWIGIPDPAASAAIVGALWIFVAFGMGLTLAPYAAAIFALRALSPYALIPLAGTLWILMELLRMFVFSLLMMGPGSDFHAGFLGGSIGYALGHAANEFWFSLARWGGIASLSIFPVLFSAALGAVFAASPNDRRPYAIIAGLTAALFLALSLGAARDAELSRGVSPAWGGAERVTLALAQTFIPARLTESEKETAERTEVALEIARSLRARGISPDALILPESIGTRIHRDSYTRISELLSPGTLLLHAHYDGQNEIVRNVSMWAHTIGGETRVTDKRHVFPYGEYAPHHFAYPLQWFSPILHRTVVAKRSYRSGTLTELGSARGVPIGARMCVEIFYSGLYRELRERQAGILVHAASIAMFHGSDLLEGQMRAAARIRATENGLPLVQAINGGKARAYDCRGRELYPDIASDLYAVYTIPRTAVCEQQNGLQLRFW